MAVGEVSEISGAGTGERPTIRFRQAQQANTRLSADTTTPRRLRLRQLLRQLLGLLRLLRLLLELYGYHLAPGLK